LANSEEIFSRLDNYKKNAALKCKLERERQAQIERELATLSGPQLSKRSVEMCVGHMPIYARVEQVIGQKKQKIEAAATRAKLEKQARDKRSGVETDEDALKFLEQKQKDLAAKNTTSNEQFEARQKREILERERRFKELKQQREEAAKEQCSFSPMLITKQSRSLLEQTRYG
jgi:hypothetical protein